MTERKPFMVRLREKGERDLVTEIATENEMSEADVARRLLVPALQLAKIFGLHEVSSQLRRQANESLGLSRETLRRKVASAKAKLPSKAKPKSGGPKLQFG